MSIISSALVYWILLIGDIGKCDRIVLEIAKNVDGRVELQEVTSNKKSLSWSIFFQLFT